MTELSQIKHLERKLRLLDDTDEIKQLLRYIVKNQGHSTTRRRKTTHKRLLRLSHRMLVDSYLVSNHEMLDRIMLTTVAAYA